MAESSFPALEQPLTDQQWGQVTEGFGSGILAQQSEPYGIPAGGIDNAANTFRVGGRSPLTGDGRAVVSGFFHRYDADEVFTCPAVSATTTYYFGLTYDPTKHADPKGPVSLTLTKSRPSGGGKVYLPVYRITRRANELLSNATIKDERAFVAPQITVKGATALPPATSVLTYTIATDFETGRQWQMQRDGAWKPLGLDSWPIPDTGGWDMRGSVVAVEPLSSGQTEYRMSVQMRRTGTAYTLGTNYSSNGLLVPSQVRGSRGIVYGPAMIQSTLGMVAVNTTTGEVQTRVESGTALVNPNHTIAFNVGWVA